MKKGKIILVIIISIALFIILSAIRIIMNGWKSFFEFNVIELLTFIIASIVLFFVTEMVERKNKKDSKLDDTILKIVAKLQEICLEVPTSSDKSRYLYILKYISNKFVLVNELCDERDKKNIEDAKKDFDTLRDFIIDNINLGPSYFEDEERKNKIPNLISNIETYLDKVVIRIYS